MPVIPAKYFLCHHCQIVFFLPLIFVATSRPSCPACNGGFLQEITSPNRPSQSTATAEYSPAVLNNSASTSLASSSTHAPSSYSPNLVQQALIAADESAIPVPSIVGFRNLPSRTVTEEMLNSDELNQCMICLDEFQVGNEIKEMPCRHVFHLTCLSLWLESCNTCPICRFQLPKDSEMDYGVHGNAVSNILGSLLGEDEDMYLISDHQQDDSH